MISALFINFVYVFSAFLFIVGLKKLTSAKTARMGNRLSALAMLIALCVTLADQQILTYQWIAVGLGIGLVVGVVAARMIAMTAMPEMVALLNGFGGISSLLLGTAAFFVSSDVSFLVTGSVVVSVVIGGITFTGSLVAWAKLSEKLPGRPLLFWGQQAFNAALFLGVFAAGLLFVFNPYEPMYFYAVIGLSLIIGILSVIPIGGGDMPVVISLLNSYSGLAACAAGFAIQNNLLIVAGALVGASGLILTKIMCKAMNRSLVNVLFSGFGASVSASNSEEQGEVNPITVEDAYYVLEAATSIVVVPGYGMAVAQAQHVVTELAELLEAQGAEIQFAIHPVAGRMPGHMNVLLAEANVPYDQLVEMDDINPTIDQVDVVLVVGANDVVNPDAREREDSPLYGMPIINVDKAKTVFVLKRSMNSGFAGVQNPLFYKSNTRMLFGDAKASIAGLVSQFKSS
ncbi:MAG: NAD(P) transhydrogenase subunit beta [Candidatus Marinamargulisbacteria bacterium]|jgi:NAD(P) transhydrogenase subunit beta